MKTPIILLSAGLFLLFPLNVFSDTFDAFEMRSDGSVVLGNRQFENMNAYLSSRVFRDEGRRCGLDNIALSRQATRGPRAPIARSISDCTTTLTQIQTEYWPSDFNYYVPVWFHVIHRTNGTGNITDQRINDQITVLNEDFGAISGSLGENGFNVRIQFQLAGIDRIQSNRWYTDSMSDEFAYKTALQKDPDKYLNVYTNDADGYLGYAYFPQDAAGNVYDGVVMLHSAIGGRDNGFYIYDEGRTLVHEVGHYFGLDHTFSGNGSGSCVNSYSDGDLIVDTNAQSAPQYDCPATIPSSCGSLDPIDNYMGYNDDNCMILFTAEQANRSVCGLVNYRQSLFNRDTDGIDDAIDNCPTMNNAGQEDLDGNSEGNVCDDDVDGDNICVPGGDQDENDCDTDDDNDGVPDSEETGGPADNPHAFDPDRDDDGIIDGLDRNRDSSDNNLCLGEAPDAILSESIVGDSTCADPSSVTTLAPPASVTETGDLLIISPQVTFETEFFVAPGGELKVISQDPTAPIPNPPP